MVTLPPDIALRINASPWLGWVIIVLAMLAILAPTMAGKAAVLLVALLSPHCGVGPALWCVAVRQSTSSRVLTLVLGATATVAAIFMLIHPLLGGS